jgi:hypothetical protein
VASFLHITDERRALRLLRIGIPAARHHGVAVEGKAFHCAVVCFPLAAHFPMCARRRRDPTLRHRRCARAIEFRIDDGEHVLLRYRGRELERMTAAEAAAFFLWTADARGFEVLVPRAILAREIASMRTISELTAWSFHRASARPTVLWWSRSALARQADGLPGAIALYDPYVRCWHKAAAT